MGYGGYVDVNIYMSMNNNVSVWLSLLIAMNMHDASIWILRMCHLY